MNVPLLNHQGTVTLETDRLILRPFRKGDELFMFSNWSSDPDVVRYMSWPRHLSVGDSRTVVSLWLKNQKSDGWYNWAIVPKIAGHPIGSIGILNIDSRTRSGDIGYCIAKNWWGNGMVPEAFRAVRDYMFDTVGLEKIKAKHCVENPKSGRVMQKCGMLHEGTDRKSVV